MARLRARAKTAGPIPHIPLYLLSGLASIVFWFLARFAIFGREFFPRGMPEILKPQFRAGFGLCITGLMLGLFGIANGYDTPLISSDVAVVAKHTTRHRDPANRVYYVALRAWPASRAVVELGVPRNLYDRLDVPLTAIGTPQDELDALPERAYVRLVVGEDRLGLEWFKGMNFQEAQPADSGLGRAP